jgi:hypothetical protein
MGRTIGTPDSRLIAWKDGQGDVVGYLEIMNRVGDRLYWIGGAGDAWVPAYWRKNKAPG